MMSSQGNAELRDLRPLGDCCWCLPRIPSIEKHLNYFLKLYLQPYTWLPECVCVGLSHNLYHAVANNSHLSKCIRCSSLEQSLFHISTTASLSQSTYTPVLCHLQSHIIHASTIRIIPFWAIDHPSSPSGQCNCSHPSFHQAQQPKGPDASVSAFMSNSPTGPIEQQAHPFPPVKKLMPPLQVKPENSIQMYKLLLSH